jgi:uncharacterized protein (DUF2336 family)
LAAITTAVVVGATVAGTAMQGYGAYQGSKAAKKNAQAQQAIAEQERIQNELRMKNMQLEAGRKQREIIRSSQRARAMSLATATAQGAAGDGSSALGGAYGQTSGATQNSLLGINQALQLGYLTADSNNIISGERVNMADASSMAATAQGWSSFGSSLASSAQGLGRLSGGMNFGANYGSQPAFGITPSYGGMY